MRNVNKSGWTWITKKYSQRLIYLPAERTTEARGNYVGKLIFKHVQITLVASNEPLMGPLPRTTAGLEDWLRDKRCIYAIDTFDVNLCVWKCLATYTKYMSLVKKIKWKKETVWPP